MSGLWWEDDDPEVRRLGLKHALDAGIRAEIPRAAKLLADPDRAVRDAAFTALQAFGGRESAEAVLPHLRSPDEALRNCARELLAPLALVAPEAFLPYLHDSDVDVQIFVVELLGSSKAPRFCRELGPMIESGPPNLRNQIAIALGQRGREDGLELLSRLVEDEEIWVRFAALEALGKIPGEAARCVLVKALNGEDMLLASGALEALLPRLELGADEVLGALPRFASDTSFVANAVSRLLDVLESGGVKAPSSEAIDRVRETLIRAASTGNMWDRARAIRLLACLGDHVAGARILELARNAEGPAQIAAIQALATLRPSGTKELLKELLAHRDVEIVERARDALNEIGRS